MEDSRRRAHTNFIEGVDSQIPLDLTFNQTPHDPSAGEADKPGFSGATGTIFTSTPPDSQGATPVDDARVIRACIETRRYEEEQRQPTREGTDRISDLYHGKYDFSHKEDWQSKRVSPKVFTTVERIASTVMRIKERSRDWFDVEALTEDSQVYYNTVKSLLRFYLDSDEVQFDNQLRTGLKSGLLNHMMYFLVTWENDSHTEVESEESSATVTGPTDGFSQALDFTGAAASAEANQEPVMPGATQSKLRIEVLNPDYVYLDATGRDRFKIWEVKYTRGEAMREAEARGWDKEALRMAMTAPSTTTDTANTIGGFHEARDARKQDKLPEYKVNSKVKITNYFGDLYDQATGEILYENTYFILVNDTKLIYGPVPNPFWEGKDPIIAAPFTEVPFAAYGRSPLIQNIDMFESFVEFYNLLQDYLQTTLLSIREIDMDLVEDWDDDIDVLYPGKVIRTSKGGQTASNAIQNVPFNDVPAGVFNFLPTIESEISANVMLSDVVSGSPRPRGRMTAMEDNRRASDAGAMMEFIFNAIQDNLLAPIIRTCFYRILQFMPQAMWTDWITTHQKEIMPKDPEQAADWEDIYEEMKTWSPSQRWNKLAGLFKFKVRVFSALGDKQAEIEKATFFIQTLSQMPGAADLVNWKKVIRHVATSFDWDPEEILKPTAIPSANVESTPTGENVNVDGSQLQASGGEGTIDKGPSLGAPTSISTNTPFIPGNSDGNPGKGSGPR